jgi:chromosome segregation ATPase
MTDEEINRKFDVVANHLAALAVGLDQLKERVDSLAGSVDSLSESQRRAEKRWERTEDGIRALLAIAEIHEREITVLHETARSTDDKLNVLISTVDRFISGRGES